MDKATEILSNALGNMSKRDSIERLKKFPIGTLVRGENTNGYTLIGEITEDKNGFLYIKSNDKRFTTNIHQMSILHMVKID